MPQSKSVSKERYERQRKGRELRRTLAAITPSNSHQQNQSPLFAVLPAEIRLSIYKLMLSQQHDFDRPIDFHSISPLYRPGHTHRSIVNFSMLLTCRLVYHEAHAIPLRSATHHFRYLGSTSWLYNVDIWLHHVTKQRGAELYHLHDNLVALDRQNFSKFLLPHLLWRRITGTICCYLLPPILSQHRQINYLSETLGALQLPTSCREVNLELETRQDLMQYWPDMQQHIQACKQITLNRCDGSQLEIDPRFAVTYKWLGSGDARWGSSGTTEAKHKMVYLTVRLCWRAHVARREYMSYDHLDCLRVDDCEVIAEGTSVMDGFG